MDQTPTPKGEPERTDPADKAGDGGPARRRVKVAERLDVAAPAPAPQTDSSTEDPLSWLASERAAAASRPAQRPAAHRTPIPRWLPWAIGGGAGALVIVIGVVVWLSRPGSKPVATDSPGPKRGSADPAPELPGGPVAATAKPEPNAILVLDWPEGERGGAAVTIDGQPVVLPSSGEVKYSLRTRAAAYRIVLTRPGHENIEFEHRAEGGETAFPYPVRWRAAGPPAAELAGRPAAGPSHEASAPPAATPVPPKPPGATPPDPITPDEPEAKPGAADVAETKPLPAVPERRPEGMSPEDFLKRHDLAKSGDLWLLAAEKNVQQRAMRLAATRKELTRKQNVAKTVDAQRQAADKAFQEAKDYLTVLGRQFEAAVVVRPGDLAVLNAAKARYDEAKRAADQAKEASDKARSEINALGESIAEESKKLRERHDQVKRQYAALAQAAAIRQAIADANASAAKPASLGPSESFRAVERRIEEFEGLLAALYERVPIRQRGRLWYIDVDLAGKKKLEMAIDTGAEILCLPWKAAYEAGLDPDRGKEVFVGVADGTTVRARRVTIPTVQIGRFTARNVECAVMPPEAGDVTPLLGQTYLGRYSYRIDAGDRVLILSGSSEEKPAEGRGKR